MKKTGTFGILASLFFLLVFVKANAGTFNVSSDWGSGFTAQMQVQNNTGKKVESWTVEFDFQHEITSIWNAKIASHSGNHYVIQNASWNGTVQAGGTVSFGFNGSPGNVVPPTNIKFNGEGVEQENRAPVANDDSAETFKGEAVSISILANDSDPDGDSFSVKELGSPSHGSVVLNSDRASVSYTPEASFVGTDSFAYSIDDGKGKTDSATVQITVKEKQTTNDSPLVITVSDDWGSGFTAQAQLTNISGKQIDSWTVEFDYPYNIGNIWNATIVSHTGTRYVVKNASWNGKMEAGAKVLFGFVASPGNPSTQPTNVVFNGIAVEDKNNSPTANDDTASTEQETALTINVLANDTDPDGDILSISEVGVPQHGAASITEDKKIKYIPAVGYNGSDYFTYSISDGKGGADSARVDVVVNPIVVVLPEISVDDVTVTEGGGNAVFTVSLSVQSDKNVSVDYSTSDKTASSSQDYNAVSGTLLFLPGETAKNVTVAVIDDSLSEPTEQYNLVLSNASNATVSKETGVGFIVDNDSSSVNRPPVAVDDSSTVKTGNSVTISVLANDSDPDNDPLQITFIGLPQNGTAEFSSDSKSVIYTPDEGFTGTDSFDYTVSDGNGGTDEGLVSVEVKDSSSSSSYKVIGYYTNWSMYRNPSFTPKDIDGSKLTHINYAFAKIDASGNVLLFDKWADIEHRDDWNTQLPYYGNFRELVDLKKKYPHLKVLISIGGWTLSNEFPAMAANPQARANFVQKCIEFCETYDCFDGVDLDWEYPGYSEHAGTSADKENFTALLKEMHTAFKAHSPQLLISIAAPCGPQNYRNLELDKIHNYLDWINLMSYDFHGVWGGETVTNHQSALYRTEQGDSRFNADYAVKQYIAGGVPSEKLVLGVPLYGRTYASSSSTKDGLYSSFSGSGSGTAPDDPGLRYFYDIKRNLTGVYTRYWDEKCMVPYMHNENSSSSTYNEFICYDDEQSIGVKASYIRDNSMGGMMFWELGFDTWDDDTWDAVNAAYEGLNPEEETTTLMTASVVESKSLTTTSPSVSLLSSRATVAKAASLPDLIVNLDDSYSVEIARPGDKCKLKCAVKNIGDVKADNSVLKVFLSKDENCDSNDIMLTERKVGGLDVGESLTRKIRAQIPENVPDGKWNVIFKTDADDAVEEKEESNNCSMFEIEIARPDLLVSLENPCSGDSSEKDYKPGLIVRLSGKKEFASFGRNSLESKLAKNSSKDKIGTYSKGQRVRIFCQVINKGKVKADASKLKLYLSRDGKYDDNDIYLGNRKIPGIKPGSSCSRIAKFKIPENAEAGSWRIIFKSDAEGKVAESNENNNLEFMKIKIVKKSGNAK